MLNDKINQVALAPPPRTKKQLRAFLGLTGFYGRFIQDYARIAAPLTDALKGGNSTPLRWSPTEETAVEIWRPEVVIKYSMVTLSKSK